MSLAVTPLILTFNEAPNIGRTLSRLAWARDVVMVDSHSTDDTRAIAARYPNVRVFERGFTTHAEQWNYGLDATGIATDWVLALDADFVLTDEVSREIQSLQPADDVAGYWASFTYCIEGEPLRGAAYPPVAVLYRRSLGRYAQDGHTQRIQVNGRLVSLTHPILHDDRKPLTHWLWSQARYMQLEADKLALARDVGLVDRVRKWIVVAPPAMFLYCYVVRGGILSGRAGLFYALQRATSEAILSLYIVRRWLRPADDGR